MSKVAGIWICVGLLALAGYEGGAFALGFIALLFTFGSEQR